MQSKAKTVDEYIKEFSAEEQDVLNQIRNCILENLPSGYVEGMQYGMMSYYVPLSAYPKGYLNDPDVPVSYIALAKQKHHYAFYSLATYALKELFEKEKKRYEQEYGKLDHGVACIRFRNKNKIDYQMIGRITAALSLEDYIAYYDKERGSR